MRHLTVRNVPDEVAKALLRHKQESGCSTNQAVIDLLRKALGLPPSATWDNGLAEHAGSWDAEDLAEFEQATRAFEEIDLELWK